MNLKIFKLRSGEEVVCQVLEETKTKFKISDPLVFKTSIVSDERGSYDMTVLRDWLAYTENKTTEIPKNHIVLQYDPTGDTQKLYTLQLETEKNHNEKLISLDNNEEYDEGLSGEDPTQSQNKLFQDFLNSVVDKAEESKSEYEQQEESNPFMGRGSKPKRRRRRQSEMPSPEMNPNEMDRHGIYVSMMLPAEAIMNLITSGILSPKDVMGMIKEVKRKNRFTGDEKDRTDFGSKFSDWNSDPNSDEYK